MWALLRRIIPADIAISVAIWVLAIGILGLFDTLEMRLDWSRVTDPEYIAEVLTLTSIGLFIFTMALLKKASKYREADTYTQSVEDEVNDSIVKTNTSNLISFVRYENLTRRERAYRDKMNFKMGQLIGKANTEDIRVWDEGSEDEKKSNRFCRKMEHLSYISSDEYIEKHRPHLKARFRKITIPFLKSGVQSRDDGSEENPSRPFAIAVRDNMFNFTAPIVLVAFLLSLILQEGEKLGLIGLFVIGIKVLLLIVQHFNGTYYAARWIKLTWVADTHLRYSLWCRYLEWKTKNKEADDNGQLRLSRQGELYPAGTEGPGEYQDGEPDGQPAGDRVQPEYRTTGAGVRTSGNTG